MLTIYILQRACQSKFSLLTSCSVPLRKRRLCRPITPFTLHSSCTASVAPSGRPITPFTLHPSPFFLHPSSFTLHPSPFILHPSSFTLHPSLFTLNPSPLTLHPSSFTLHPSSFTLHPSPFILHPSRSAMTIDPDRRNDVVSPYGTMLRVRYGQRALSEDEKPITRTGNVSCLHCS